MSSIFVKIVLFLNKYSIINTELDVIFIRWIRDRYNVYFDWDRDYYLINFYLRQKISKNDIYYLDLLMVLHLYKDYLGFKITEDCITVYTKKLFRR